MQDFQGHTAAPSSFHLRNQMDDRPVGAVGVDFISDLFEPSEADECTSPMNRLQYVEALGHPTRRLAVVLRHHAPSIVGLNIFRMTLSYSRTMMLRTASNTTWFWEFNAD